MIDYRDFMARYKLWIGPDGRRGNVKHLVERWQRFSVL
jgi:hypothetical protein